MPKVHAICLGIAVLHTQLGLAAEWNQWRGPLRTGVAADSPALLEGLPTTGLKPLWMSPPIKSAGNGGWSSPVISQGNVYLYTHERTQLRELGKKLYPYLAPEKRTGMSDAEYREYEIKRRDEDEARGKAFQFVDRVYCFRAADGEPRWQYQHDAVYSRFPQSGSPTVANGRLYALGAGRRLFCLNVENGEQQWEVRLPGEFRDEFMQASLLEIEETLIVMATHLFGVDAQTGEIIWQGDPAKTQGSHSSPVNWECNGKQYAVVNVGGGNTICLEPRTGKELWRVKSEGTLATPVIVGNRLITYGNSRKKGMRCYELSATDAKLLWTFHGTTDKGSSPVVVGDFVFVQGERRLACVDLQTGKASWQTTLDLASPQYVSLIAADAKVFYCCEGLLSFAATAAAYEPLVMAKIDNTGWMASEQTHRDTLGLDEMEKQPGGLAKAQKIFQQKIGKHGPLPCASPAIADGLMFIRLKNGLACYDFRKQ